MQAFFLWLALKGLDFKVIQKSLAKANYLWVLFASVFGILAYWFRAVRWNLLLEPMGHQISNSNSLWSISFGYLMNLTIPRSGEVARATALYGVEGVPVDKSFGTIILERVVDLICMLGFLGLTLIFKYKAILSFYENSGIDINPNKILIILLILVAGTILFFCSQEEACSNSSFRKDYWLYRWNLPGDHFDFQAETERKVYFVYAGNLDILLFCSLSCMFCTSGNFKLHHC
ncbi:lysylphosphatidylglycerol synthase transmembrane domain-containing protein [Chryseobacterium proteolyticum]|uniref:lysylphosphatidylglycerol synthase transmembrane domain-containing protein n=1 Tax=Chryseobacterium proteolyticum TaxID=118127 RepID=UPI003983A77D